MVEPFTIGLHAVLLDFPSDEETILIVGAGSIGLVTLAALRALGSKARILISARYNFQAEAAQRLGADEVLLGGDLYEKVAEQTGAQVLKPMVGKRVVLGGADRVYLCVGNGSAVDDANRMARTGAKVVIVGTPAFARGVEWTAIFAQELQIFAADRYSHSEQYKGKSWRTFALAIDLMSKGKVNLGWMVSRRYKLEDYAKALGDLSNKKKHPIIKAVFDFS